MTLTGNENLDEWKTIAGESIDGCQNGFSRLVGKADNRCEYVLNMAIVHMMKWNLRRGK